VDDGSPTATAVGIKFAQDVFGVPATSYVKVQAPAWNEPDLSPQPAPAQVLLEASYRDIATRLPLSQLQLLDDDAGYVGTLGARPNGIALDYALMTKVDGEASYGERGTGDFAPSGLLQEAIGPTVTNIVLTGFVDLDLVEIGSEVLIDNELCRVDAIDAEAGTATIGRGCVDTVPASHLLGARVWFTDYFTGVDPTEYATGEKIDAQLLTRTGQGELDMALAPVSQITLAQRQARPYPPGNLRINDTRYPASIEGALSLAWSSRNRILQSDQLVDTLQGDIAAEDGTTYTVKVYLNGSLDSAEAGIEGTSYTPTVSGDGTVRVEITAQREGLDSWQALAATFDYTRAPDRLTEDGDTRITEAGDTRILES
jgi:hypothetical protein